MSKLRGNFFITSYVKSGMLTHDKERALTTPTRSCPRAVWCACCSVCMGDGPRRRQFRERHVVPAIMSWAQVTCGEERPQRDFYARLSHPLKEFHTLPGFYHDTLGEKDHHDCGAQDPALHHAVFCYTLAGS